MKKASICAALLAAVLTVCASLPAAWGYFTTYAQAKGGYPLYLGQETEIHEDFSDWTKHVTIENTSELSPVFVRARGFTDSSHSLTYSAPEGGWHEEEGWWYYEAILQPGETTKTLDVKISFPAGEEPEEGDEFNVVVVYESTLVLYDKDGNPYADWSNVLTSYEEGA